MRLDKLRLKNFRCFSDIELAFNDRLTVLVAENGQGKSALLDAIRVALWPFVSAFDVVTGTMPNSGIEIDDVRLARGIGNNMEPQLPARIEAIATFDGASIPWARQRDKVSKRARTTVKEAKHLAELGSRLQEAIRMFTADETEYDKAPETPLPVIAYYGTGRLWKQRYLTLKNQSISDVFSRTYAYVGCLDSGSDYKYFAEWFFYLYASDFEQKTRQLEKQGFAGLIDERFVYADLVQAIRTPVDQILAPLGWKNLNYSPSQQTLVIDHEQWGTLKVDQLSDGLKSMIAMTADIAYRCVRLNVELGKDAPKKTAGIVLIDEVDMHLHPRWQQVVLGQLQKAFPKVQFIVTTHSPQVLTTVDKSCIRLIKMQWDAEEDSWGWLSSVPDFQTRGVASYEALARIMGIDPIPDVEEAQWIADYTAAIENGTHDDAQGRALREKLLAFYGANHPVMLDADRLIRFQSFKLRKQTADKD